MTNRAPAVKVTDLHVGYGKNRILSDFELEIPVGTIFGIVGPNGAGKSTLLKALLQQLRPERGTVEFFGAAWSRQLQRISYIPQTLQVAGDFPISVLEVAAMGTFHQLGWRKAVTSDARATALAALTEVGIADLAERSISALSGGQRQRVFLARALASQAELFFLDEPFQGIDAPSEHAIMAVLRRLRNQGRTVVLVHHDLATVPDYCDAVALINGSVIAAGPVTEVFTPANLQACYGGPVAIVGRTAPVTLTP